VNKTKKGKKRSEHKQANKEIRGIGEKGWDKKKKIKKKILK
jgi:hypothetical protein